jgi:hypothetical protein
MPNISQAYILERIKGETVTNTKRLRDIFKRNPEAFKALIEQGPGKGMFRLKE